MARFGTQWAKRVDDLERVIAAKDAEIAKLRAERDEAKRCLHVEMSMRKDAEVLPPKTGTGPWRVVNGHDGAKAVRHDDGRFWFNAYFQASIAVDVAALLNQVEVERGASAEWRRLALAAADRIEKNADILSSFDEDAANAVYRYRMATDHSIESEIRRTKMKRLNERQLKEIENDPALKMNGGASAAGDAATYRRALKKCLKLSEYGNGVTLDMCLTAIVRTIERALAREPRQ